MCSHPEQRGNHDGGIQNVDRTSRKVGTSLKKICLLSTTLLLLSPVSISILVILQKSSILQAAQFIQKSN